MQAHPDPAVPNPSGQLERLAGRIAELERKLDSVTNVINGGCAPAVPVVTSLPAAGRIGRLLILTSDQKLYRDNGAAWVAIG